MRFCSADGCAFVLKSASPNFRCLHSAFFGATGPAAPRGVPLPFLPPSLGLCRAARSPHFTPGCDIFGLPHLQPQPAEKMTDSAPPDPTITTTTAFPDPAVIVDPAVAKGQCEQTDTQQQQQQQPGTESQGGGLKMDQEMKITDSIEDRGRRSKLRGSPSAWSPWRTLCVMPQRVVRCLFFLTVR